MYFQNALDSLWWKAYWAGKAPWWTMYREENHTALHLLLRYLNQEEMVEYTTDRQITVKGSLGNTYTVDYYGTPKPIEVVNDEETYNGKSLSEVLDWGHALCVYPSPDGGIHTVPPPDRVLANLLWLKNDEEYLLRNAAS